jgi:hypothetical protein
MRTEEWNELCNCAVCGAVVSPRIDRTYPFGASSLLCWDCAVRRGGNYDLIDDRWVVAPDTSDLGWQPRPHA